MNVTKINSSYKINFLGKIIDSHAHVGSHGNKTYTKPDLDVFIRTKLPNNDTVEKIFVSDLDVLHCNKGEYEGNKAILKTFKDSNNYEFFVSCNPKNGNINNIKKLFREYPNKFIGLKFHSDIQQLDLADKKYEPYMEFASNNNLPTLFHSQVELLDGGFINKNKKHISDPESIYQLAKKYPKIPVVMAHMGAGYNESHEKAINTLVKSIENGDANLFADISWVDIDAGNKNNIIKAIKKLKGINDKTWKYGDQSYRLMFGSDAPIDRFQNSTTNNAIEKYTNFINEIKHAIKEDKDLQKDADKIIEDLFYNNAKKLYLPKSQKKNYLLYKIAAPILIAATLIIGYYVYKNYNKTNNPVVSHK